MFTGGRPTRNTQWSGYLAYSGPLNGKHKINILCALCGSAVTIKSYKKCQNNYCRISNSDQRDAQSVHAITALVPAISKKSIFPGVDAFGNGIADPGQQIRKLLHGF